MRAKCSNNIINQQIKSGRKVVGKNSSSVNNDNLMIDDCGDLDENNEKSVGFVQEWINTYVFLSREFANFFFVISFSLSLLPHPISFVGYVFSFRDSTVFNVASKFLSEKVKCANWSSSSYRQAEHWWNFNQVGWYLSFDIKISSFSRLCWSERIRKSVYLNCQLLLPLRLLPKSKAKHTLTHITSPTKDKQNELK